MNTPHYHLDWLKEQPASARQWLFFWGHTPPVDGAVGKHIFSQWWPSPFTVEGITYVTAEHWMMAQKALLFGDTAIHQQILDTPSPKEAKALGRLVKSFDPTIWEMHRFDKVCTGNAHKFSQHPEYRAYLLATGDRILVEASPVDTIWGIGLTEKSPHAIDPHQWRGLNLLGFALMEVRKQLRAEPTHLQ